jgi:hypothetical protein
MIIAVLRANELVGQWELEGLERVLVHAKGLLLQWGITGDALSVTKGGLQTAMPDQQE